MLFNEKQSKLWLNMINAIIDFRKGKIRYTTLVYGLEGALDEGEFKNEVLIKKWYDYWTPLEILYAKKKDSVTLEEVEKHLSTMEIFLKRTYLILKYPSL